MFGCRHKRTTFPQTPNRGDGPRRTYIACLDCGMEFDYDWPTAKVQERKGGCLKRRINWLMDIITYMRIWCPLAWEASRNGVPSEDVDRYIADQYPDSWSHLQALRKLHSRMRSVNA